MKKSSKVILMLLVFFTCTAFDRLSKQAAQQTLAGAPARSYLGGFIQLQYAENSGAMLGLGSSLSPQVRLALLVLFNSLLLLGVLVYLWRTAELAPAALVGGTLIVAGGFNNIFDRLLHSGRVVDFMYIGFERLHSGVFNIADVAIMAGILLLFLSLKQPHPDAAFHPDLPD